MPHGVKRTYFYFLQIAHSVKSMIDCFAEARGFQRERRDMAKRRNVKSGATEEDAWALGVMRSFVLCG